jgi:hypothetical protein
VPGTGIEPVRGKPPQDFKSCVSASSTTPAHREIKHLACLDTSSATKLLPFWWHIHKTLAAQGLAAYAIAQTLV